MCILRVLPDTKSRLPRGRPLSHSVLTIAPSPYEMPSGIWSGPAPVRFGRSVNLEIRQWGPHSLHCVLALATESELLSEVASRFPWNRAERKPRADGSNRRRSTSEYPGFADLHPGPFRKRR